MKIGEKEGTRTERDREKNRKRERRKGVGEREDVQQCKSCMNRHYHFGHRTYGRVWKIKKWWKARGQLRWVGARGERGARQVGLIKLVCRGGHTCALDRCVRVWSRAWMWQWESLFVLSSFTTVVNFPFPNLFLVDSVNYRFNFFESVVFLY